MAKEQFEIYFFGSGTVEAFSFSFGWMWEHHTEDKPVFVVKRTFPEALAELGRILGREVRYQAIPLDAWQERIADNPGVFSGTNRVVKQITGKEPMGVAEFVQKNKQFFEDSSAAGSLAC